MFSSCLLIFIMLLRLNGLQAFRNVARTLMRPPIARKMSSIDTSQHIVYVGNLPLDYSLERFNDFASSLGISGHSGRLVMQGNSFRGFGYLDFETAEEANSAMGKLEGSEVEGRKLKVDMDAGTDGPTMGRRPSLFSDDNSVFIGNLAFNMEKKDIQKLIEDEIGKVTMKVRLAVAENMRSKGYCHVDFTNQEDVDLVISKLHLQIVRGREINVARSIPRVRNSVENDFTTDNDYVDRDQSNRNSQRDVGISRSDNRYIRKGIDGLSRKDDSTHFVPRGEYPRQTRQGRADLPNDNYDDGEQTNYNRPRNVDVGRSENRLVRNGNDGSANTDGITRFVPRNGGEDPRKTRQGSGIGGNGYLQRIGRGRDRAVEEGEEDTSESRSHFARGIRFNRNMYEGDGGRGEDRENRGESRFDRGGAGRRFERRNDDERQGSGGWERGSQRRQSERSFDRNNRSEGDNYSNRKRRSDDN